MHALKTEHSTTEAVVIVKWCDGRQGADCNFLLYVVQRCQGLGFYSAYLPQLLLIPEAPEAAMWRGAPLCASHDAAWVTGVAAGLTYV